VSEIRKFFDGRVEEWDTERYLDETYISRGRLALRFLSQAGRSKRVLDLGCGTGRQSLALIQAGDLVVSADFSPEMARATLDRIRREAPHASPAVVVADATHLPFRAGSFDAVVALGLVGFIKDRLKLLAELKSMLRGGGDLVCDAGVPEREVLFQAISRSLTRPVITAGNFWRAVRGKGKQVKENRGWYFQNFIKHSPREFERILIGAGFDPVARGGAGFGDLKVGERSLVPWRVQNWMSRTLSQMSVLPGGSLVARHALTYVVRSVRHANPADLSSTAADARANGRHAPAIRS
jgi:ubiquinone/menaquinone biosynthesis C-methylase UbiE